MSASPGTIAQLEGVWWAKWDDWMAMRGYNRTSMERLIRNYGDGDDAFGGIGQAVMTWTLAFWDTAKTWADKVVLNLMFIQGMLLCSPDHYGPVYDISDERREALLRLCVKLSAVSQDSQSSLAASDTKQREYIVLQVPSDVYYRILPKMSSHLPRWIAWVAQKDDIVSTNYGVDHIYQIQDEPSSDPVGSPHDTLLRLKGKKFFMQIPLTKSYQNGKWSTETSQIIFTNRGANENAGVSTIDGVSLYEIAFIDLRWPTTNTNHDGQLLDVLFQNL